ncbi:MAG TPA: hypothetical protein VG455_07025, partial [Acidimicrobiales bacterium]|nr:hypothetical protein [Acidimicrobiales bacterium]
MADRRGRVGLLAAAGLLAMGGCRDGGLTAVQAPPDATRPPATAEPIPSAPPDTAVPEGKGVVVTPAGVVVPVVADAPGGWLVRTPCGKERTIADGTLVRSATIVLDAGHGGG